MKLDSTYFAENLENPFKIIGQKNMLYFGLINQSP